MTTETRTKQPELEAMALQFEHELAEDLNDPTMMSAGSIVGGELTPMILRFARLVQHSTAEKACREVCMGHHGVGKFDGWVHSVACAAIRRALLTEEDHE